MLKYQRIKVIVAFRLYFKDIGWVLLFRFHLRSTFSLRTPHYYGHLDNTESNETPGNTIHVTRELLHFALLHYASEKFLHFVLNTLLHFASMLLHFALVLHFATIITFCGVIDHHLACGFLPKRVQLRKNRNSY